MSYKIERYKEVNDLIQRLLKEVKCVLGEQFIGMYIHGSLAVGDFNPKNSDVDFLVVTKEMVTEDLFCSLKKIHEKIIAEGNKLAKRLEGSYVSKEFLLSKEPPKKPRPYVNESEFCLEHYGYEWLIEQYTIRENGIVIEGPNPKDIINPISSAELKKASLKLLNSWWAPIIIELSPLRDCHYQTYAVLTMCRILYMFDRGAIVSKKVSAKWALSTLDEEWKILIEKAVEWEEGVVFNHMEETQDFIRFTLEYTAKDNITS